MCLVQEDAENLGDEEKARSAASDTETHWKLLHACYACLNLTGVDRDKSLRFE